MAAIASLSTARIAGDAECVLTPLGLLPQTGLAVLRAFGEEAERLEYPCIDVGGFIVPGRGPAVSDLPGEESNNHGRTAGAAWRGRPAREEAGPAAWARQRPSSSQAAAPGASPHALEQRLNHLHLDLPGLVDYHPLARVTASTEEVVYFDIPVGLFREIPIRARLTLEVPLFSRERLSRPFVESRVTTPPFELRLEPRLPTSVPDVRAWAVWEGGALHALRVVSHHRNPDTSICACLPHEWVRGVHPLRDYVAFCIVWIGKVLHERLLGFYPGRQHFGAFDRVRRDRVDEYCGCGSAQRYRDCCRDGDHRRTSFDRWREAMSARRQYLQELAWQGRTPSPPDDLLRGGLARP